MVAVGVFGDVQNALAAYVGGTDIAGAILWLSVSVVLFIALEIVFALDRRGRGNTSAVFVISGGFGTGIAFLVGWIGPAIPIFIAFLLMFIAMDPLDRRGGGNG